MEWGKSHKTFRDQMDFFPYEKIYKEVWKDLKERANLKKVA